MDLADFLKDYVMPIGMVITFIGTLFTVYYTRKNTTHTKYIDTVTSERIKWMEKLREYISEYISILKVETDLIDDVKKIRLLESKIELHLNHKGKKDLEIRSLIKKIAIYRSDKFYYREKALLLIEEYNNCKNNIGFNKNGEYEVVIKYLECVKYFGSGNLDEDVKKLVIIVNDYLKEEWERVKLETQKGYFVKGDDLFEL